MATDARHVSGGKMDFLTTSEAAKILDLSPDSVRRLEREGLLPALKVGKGHRLFDPRDVENLRAKRECGGATGVQA
jgi:excisionase family DNA binding protein